MAFSLLACHMPAYFDHAERRGDPFAPPETTLRLYAVSESVTAIPYEKWMEDSHFRLKREELLGVEKSKAETELRRQCERLAGRWQSAAPAGELLYVAESGDGRYIITARYEANGFCSVPTTELGWLSAWYATGPVGELD